MAKTQSWFEVHYLQVIDGDPWINWEFLDVWNQKLDTCIPVSKQEHSENEIHDTSDRPCGIENLHKEKHNYQSDSSMQSVFYHTSSHLFK